MADQSIVHDTFVIERTYPKVAAKVFAAFSETSRKRRWFAESPDHDVEHYSMDFEVGGQESALYRFKKGTPFASIALAYDGRFLDIVADHRIVTASTMTLGDRRISASLVTAELRPKNSRTLLVLTHQAVFFEGADGPKLREAGWRALLDRLEPVV
ncbi:SRPBCC family protein [Bradyrhizobium sp. WYCCWR 13023]|uniref:SRPBCC family protein n=1 Tax=Bradyrhizobium zhengyangense TaxID=2911009 RepID=A0A9X1RES6_9BRAD|nr:MULTISPECIES: SRPBCC family protein [Bradyrhizobium]MCG2630222.1 SRPBCC family protein [Bradyrhizobium zhengyangense]MCG2666147.1 SRPBCC family protein [Bradyrhizobium zhengyangense]MDA9521053.1 polyketide cyclase [Bradyrhizobium sp. CCBAU 11434]